MTTVTTRGGSSRAHNETSIGTTASQVLAANTDRTNFEVKNRGGDDIFIGSTSNVTTGDGVKIPPGASFANKDTDAVYAISNSNGQKVTYYEVT